MLKIRTKAERSFYTPSYESADEFARAVLLHKGQGVVEEHREGHWKPVAFFTPNRGLVWLAPQTPSRSLAA